jgi:excisionase family DNA binding protein
MAAVLPRAPTARECGFNVRFDSETAGIVAERRSPSFRRCPVQPTDDDSIAMSIEDVARATTLNRCTVYAEMRAGRLCSFKVGRRRLVSRRALADWVNAREQEERRLAS